MGMVKGLLKDISRWLFWYPFRWFVNAIPISTAYKLGDWMAWTLYIVNGRRKAKIRTELGKLNLGRTLREDEIQNAVKIGVYMFFWNQLDILLYPKLMKQPIDFYTELEGEENLKKALEKKKGVLLAHPHIANAQMLMPALSFRNYQLNQIGLTPQDLRSELDHEQHIPDSLKNVKFEMGNAKSKISNLQSEIPPPSPMLEKVLHLMHRLEMSLPVNFIYVRQSLLPAFRCLKRNELLAVAIDGAGGRNRIIVNFLGRKASYSQGPVTMALREGAPILPLYVIRLTPSYKHRIIIEKPVELTVSGDSDKDIQTNTQQIADLFTDFISKHPDQFARLLGYKRPFFAD